jgi:hypothetical protein
VVEEIAEESEQEEQIAETTSNDGSGSGLWILVSIFIAALAAIGFWFWFWRPKRLYRFDRGDAGTYIDDDDDEITSISAFDDEIASYIEDLTTVEESEEVFEIPRASTIFIDDPPAHRLCDTTHAEWVKSVERLRQLEADADARIGTNDPQEERHDQMIRQARASMERWREMYEECLEAHPDEPVLPPPTSEPASRTDDQDPEPTPEESDGHEGGESGEEPEPESGSPGTSPPQSPPVVTIPDCLEGTTEVRVESEAGFRVLDGNVTAVSGRLAPFGSSGVSGSALSEMSDGDIEELFKDIEKQGPENKVTVKVRTRLLTIKCIRILVCSRGKWVETEQTNRVEEYSDPQTQSFPQRSQEAKRSRETVNDHVKPLLETLLANEDAAADFECDF